MAVLVYAENSGGVFKKAVLEAATYSFDLATSINEDAVALCFGKVEAAEIARLSACGIKKVLTLSGDAWSTFNDRSFAEAIKAAAQNVSASVIVLPQSYNGRTLAPRLAVSTDASLFSGATSLAKKEDGKWRVTKLANTGKGIETIEAQRNSIVVLVKTNAYGVKNSNTGTAEVNEFSFTPSGARVPVLKETIKASGKISITEADVVVSGGRGMKDPGNWKILEDLAEVLGAGTACSKPVADMHWRPHHEHVGQTGIQIGPNLYIAIGISGAIQHLAGVNSSKNIVVINKDAEAPFFKIADFGIVGDLFEVLPKITEAARKLKASS